MCQARVFIKDNKGIQEEIMKDVILIEPLGDKGTRLQAMFESPRVVNARIKSIDLLKHQVILESLDTGNNKNAVC